MTTKSGYEVKFKGTFWVDADNGDLDSMIAAKKRVEAIKELIPDEIEVTDWTEKAKNRREAK